MRQNHQSSDHLPEKALVQLSREQSSLPIDRLPLAYIRVDADFRVLDWNPTSARLFGYTRDEVLGRVVLDLILPLPLDNHIRGVIRRLQAGDMEAHSVNENRTKDGRIIICEWFNTPLMDAAGQYTGLIALGQDISERKQADARLLEYTERIESLSRQLVDILELDHGQTAHGANTTADPHDLLTPREREVLHLAARGYTCPDIASQLRLSERTVEMHRANLMHKLGLRTQTQLVAYFLDRALHPNGQRSAAPRMEGAT